MLIRIYILYFSFLALESFAIVTEDHAYVTFEEQVLFKSDIDLFQEKKASFNCIKGELPLFSQFMSYIATHPGESEEKNIPKVLKSIDFNQALVFYKLKFVPGVKKGLYPLPKFVQRKKLLASCEKYLNSQEFDELWSIEEYLKGQTAQISDVLKTQMTSAKMDKQKIWEQILKRLDEDFPHRYLLDERWGKP